MDKTRNKNVEESYTGEIGKILHRLGSDLANRSIKRESLTYYQDALIYKGVGFGKDSLSLAHTLRCIAEVQLKQYKFDMGLILFEHALQIEKKHLDDRPLVVAKTM